MTGPRSERATPPPSPEVLAFLVAVLSGVWIAAGPEISGHVGSVLALIGAVTVPAGLAARSVPRHGTPSRPTGGPVRPVVLGVMMTGWFLLALGLGVRAHAGVREAAVTRSSSVVLDGIVGSDTRPAVLRTSGTRVLLHTEDGAVPPLGTRVRVAGRLAPLRGDEARLRRYHYARVTGRLHASRVQTLGPPAPPVRFANTLRGRLQDATAGLAEDRAGLLLGLLIGDDSRLTAPTRVAFRTAGMSHLVAVSGANLVLVMAAVGAVVGRLPAGRVLRVTCIVAILGLYVLVTRAEPSVVRAGMLALVALGATAGGVRRDTGSAFVVAMMCLVLADPFIAASVGFQLSAVAAAGVLWLAPRVRRVIGRGARRREPPGPLIPGPLIPGPVLDAAALTLGAQAAVVPLLAWHFGAVPGLAGLANLVAVPIAAATTVAGAALAPLGAVWPGAFSPLIPPLDALVRLAHVASDLPLASVTVGHAGGAALIVAGAVASRVPVAGVGLAVVVLASGVILVPGWPGCHGLSFLDVGQGDATLLRGADGAVVLVDTGRSPTRLAGLLRDAGVRRIDLLVLTHDDLDHVGGAAGLDGGAVGTVLVPQGMAWASDEARLVRDMLGDRATVVPARAGDRWTVGGMALRVLHPPASPGRHGDAVDTTGDDNDSGIVLRVSVAGIDAILLADVGATVQRRLVDDVGPVDVVKLAHHGARSQDPALATTLDAAVGVVSVGPNGYGHPTSEALDLYGRHGRVRRTDEDGSVVVCRDPGGGPLAVHPVGYAAGP